MRKAYKPYEGTRDTITWQQNFFFSERDSQPPPPPPPHPIPHPHKYNTLVRYFSRYHDYVDTVVIED